jgi:hypothetical protein
MSATEIINELTDFGLAAKVRPALLLTGQPAADELDLVTWSGSEINSASPRMEKFEVKYVGAKPVD